MNIESDYVGESFELSKPVVKMKWAEAIAAEWSDGWRVPTRAELVALFDEATSSDHDFADTSIVWSASSYAPSPADAWLVDFGNGASGANLKTLGYAVRLVREAGDETCRMVEVTHTRSAWKCSACGEENDDLHKYTSDRICPYCGAKIVDWVYFEEANEVRND